MVKLTIFTQLFSIAFCSTVLFWDAFYHNNFMQILNSLALLTLAFIYYKSNKETIAVSWADFQNKYNTLFILICLAVYFLPITEIKIDNQVEKIITMCTLIMLIIRLFFMPFYKSHLER